MSKKVTENDLDEIIEWHCATMKDKLAYHIEDGNVRNNVPIKKNRW